MRRRRDDTCQQIARMVHNMPCITDCALNVASIEEHQLTNGSITQEGGVVVHAYNLDRRVWIPALHVNFAKNSMKLSCPRCNTFLQCLILNNNDPVMNQIGDALRSVQAVFVCFNFPMCGFPVDKSNCLDDYLWHNVVCFTSGISTDMRRTKMMRRQEIERDVDMFAEAQQQVRLVERQAQHNTRHKGSLHRRGFFKKQIRNTASRNKVSESLGLVRQCGMMRSLRLQSKREKRLSKSRSKWR